VKIEVDEIMTELPQTVKVPDGMKLVYIKRWRTIVPLPIAYADEIVEALRPHSSDDYASARAANEAFDRMLRNNVIEECVKAARDGFEAAMENYVLIGPSGMAMQMINSVKALAHSRPQRGGE